MIPNHAEFIEAINERKKVRVRFHSKPNNGVLDRVCAPMDYGPESEIPGQPKRYWLWDEASDGGPRTLGLLPQQIIELRVLGEVFNVGSAMGCAL